MAPVRCSSFEVSFFVHLVARADVLSQCGMFPLSRSFNRGILGRYDGILFTSSMLLLCVSQLVS